MIIFIFVTLYLFLSLLSFQNFLKVGIKSVACHLLRHRKLFFFKLEVPLFPKQFVRLISLKSAFVSNFFPHASKPDVPKYAGLQNTYSF